MRFLLRSVFSSTFGAYRRYRFFCRARTGQEKPSDRCEAFAGWASNLYGLPNRKLPIVLTSFCPEIYRKIEFPRMPLAFASTLGGTLTMIGSAANLLASDCARALEPAVELGFFALSLGWNPWEKSQNQWPQPLKAASKGFFVSLKCCM